MTTMAYMYLAYLAITIGITIWVARTLRKHGHVFLTDGMQESKELSEALSHLLVVGFYLVNFGVISFWLKSEQVADSSQAAIEALSMKVGTILVVIGAMHFLLLAVFASVRRGNEQRKSEQERRHTLVELAHRRQVTEFVDPA